MRNGTYDPPTIDIPQAVGAMTSECARTRGSANPVTTTIEVINRPRSTGPDPSYVEKSSDAQRENMALGSGANTNVKATVHQGLKYLNREKDSIPTRRGSQFDHNAHDRIIMRNPTANTKDNRITAEKIPVSGMKTQWLHSSTNS